VEDVLTDQSNTTHAIHGASHNLKVLCDPAIQIPDWREAREYKDWTSLSALLANKQSLNQVSCAECKRIATERLAAIAAVDWAPTIYSADNPAPLGASVYLMCLSTRTENCFISDGLLTIADVVEKSEREMLRLPNFGLKTLREVKETLAEIGRHLGTDVEAGLNAAAEAKQTAEEARNILARASHDTWRKQSHRDKGTSLEELSDEVPAHDQERADDAFKALEQAGFKIVRI
jgi:hypothetical protein